MIKNKVVVGILPTYDYDDTNPYKDIDRFIRMYEERIYECGAIPLGILNKDVSIYKDICDAYLWPGGKVINKEFYSIFDDVLNNHKPLLGICLGSQAIATFFNILEDQKKSQNKNLLEVYDSNKLDNLYLKKIEGDSLQIHDHYITKQDDITVAKHPITITKNTFLYDIYKTSNLDVVSFHTFKIARVDNKDLIVSAKSKDGVIEAVEYHKDNNNILGIQFHPEIIKDDKPFLWLIKKSLIKYQILVNKENEIPAFLNFKILYHDSKYLASLGQIAVEEQALYAFKKLQEEMLNNGYTIDLESGYRTTYEQEKLYNQIKEEKGEEHTNMYVAKPKHSEHETGLALDICAYVDNKWVNEFNIPESLYNKLHEICPNYGFILRYKKGKENITKYAYEPWHIRFIADVTLAKKMNEENLVLEEL